jgi:dTDP-4-amino-4,6-dideoxygalactose transaminase
VDWQAINRNRVEALVGAKQAGLSLMVHYIPLHHQPILAQACRASDLSGADRAYPGILSIPCYPDLTAAQQSQVLEWLRGLKR